MKFSNLKIGMRMGLGYAGVLVLAVAMVILGITMLGRLNGKIRDIQGVNVPRLVQSYEAGKNLDALAISIRNALLSGDESARQGIDARIDAERQALQGNLDFLYKTLARPEVRQKLQETSGRYRQVFDQVLQRLAQGDRQAAVDALNRQLVPVYADYKSILDDINQFQLAQNRRADGEINAIYDDSRSLQLLLGVLAVLIGVSCAWFVSRSITRPIGRAVRIAQRVAAGDLTQRIEVDSKDETGQLLAALREMNGGLARAVSGIRASAETISSASGQIAAGNADLSSRTEQQAASLEETAASMEELASTVKQNSDNARQANQLAAGASEVAERGGSAVSAVVGTMTSISGSSRKISEIVSVIDGIAFQTNILALNAAVEAARAGEQGKGFAVVAGEVRTLAQRSASAAKEIKALIEDSVGKVNIGSDQVMHAGATMQEIVASVKRVTDIMGEIAAASEEQTRGIDQINLAVSQMDEVTQQNAALVEESAAAAGAMQDQAAELVRSVAVFKVGAGRGQIVLDLESPVSLRLERALAQA